MKKKYRNYEDFVKNNLFKENFGNKNKFTISLIIILIIGYILELIYLNPNKILFNSLITNPNHLLIGNYYSVFTSIFLHANLVHLLTNSLALFIFGTVVEKHLKFKMVFIFIFGGIIANLVSHSLSFLTGDTFSSLGASGAIAGLIIFAILLEPLAFTKLFIFPIPIFLLGWFLISLDLIGLTNPSQVNNFAHLGGYLALLILFFFLEFRERRKIILGFTINLTLLLFTYILIKIITLEKIKILIGI